ncbi:DNA mismatch repair endonuclease MutH [Alteromonas lipolytica]|uniref:DNA mismatch repair protein MutH n=1 Tax=Alteromonas lipolytica TaxID=1856405 RepID=A0A1E8FEY5_9ALTE|nr:DNA mismatch repair endonuclease MutH [Alteromonas lipolytica]OFI34507.1 DNA mismatch repair endonuclease MutH [Alteromonas lipolytica]GGF85107.1 DNA mismatch repair protein MutH [Alteromonas lipolytica]
MQVPTSAPQDLAELESRAQAIAGFSLGELAALASIAIPADFKRHKGWTGQLIETWLGATAGSKPQQDFPELGVELKTLPINQYGQPLETTYVCYAPLKLPPLSSWETSNVKNKLQCVLWVPVEGERQIPVAERRIATPFLWQPSPAQEAMLKQDWEELTELIALGQVESVTARHGEVMQLRPKAASGQVLTDALDAQGNRIQTRPRGFYLRKQFTGFILESHFAR